MPVTQDDPFAISVHDISESEPENEFITKENWGRKINQFAFTDAGDLWR